MVSPFFFFFFFWNVDSLFKFFLILKMFCYILEMIAIWKWSLPCNVCFLNQEQKYQFLHLDYIVPSETSLYNNLLKQFLHEQYSHRLNTSLSPFTQTHLNGSHEWQISFEENETHSVSGLLEVFIRKITLESTLFTFKLSLGLFLFW